MATEEEWKAIPGCPGYEASSLGRIGSWRAVGNGRCKVRTDRHVLKQRDNHGGYKVVCIRVDRIGTPRFVHRLVASAFLGPCPTNKQVDHVDEKRANNVPSNLRYLTPKENTRRSSRVRIDESDRDEIRGLCADGLTQRQVALKWDICQPHVSRIVNRDRGL